MDNIYNQCQVNITITISTTVGLSFINKMTSIKTYFNYHTY